MKKSLLRGPSNAYILDSNLYQRHVVVKCRRVFLAPTREKKMGQGVIWAKGLEEIDVPLLR
jgi:hypothetical protein